MRPARAVRAWRPAGAGVGWCELHCHSAYSLLDGATTPEGLARCAGELGYPALALTDHDSLGGLVAHARACAAANVRPIAGVELTLDDGSHLTLLARDGTGYRNLCRVVSGAQLAGEKGAPRATLDLLASCAVGLECLTGCRRGRVPAALLRGDEGAAAAALGALRDIFGAAHTWVEAQRPGLPDDHRLGYGLARLARQARVGLVATGDAHYARAEERDLQDVLVCIRERVPLARARPHLRPGSAWRLRGPDEMGRLFADLPAALRGAIEVAERCSFTLDDVDAALPAFPVPPGHTAASYLQEVAWEGARERYGSAVDAADGTVRARLAHELDVIARLGLADYVLMVWDLVRFTRAEGILAQGRGSAVGSLVCYALGVTAVEPLAHGLSFERFLALGRTDPPDIDIDLPADRDDGRPGRERVIQYALTRYAGHAALVSTTITFRARSAVRDVGMALGLAPEQIDLLAREQEHGSGRGGMAGTDGADGAALGLPRGPMLRLLEELCARLEGLPRHLGQHPGGVVVTARPLAEVAPIERARMPGRLVVQWDKDAAEAAGLIKVDLLGLGMLTVIDACFALIGERTGARPALHGFRCDDPAVYDYFCRADTVGVFQLESRAQMTACLPRLQPRTLDDLTAAVALIRPGPLQGNATHPYLRRRQGREAVRYPGGEAGRRLLEPILGETYGVILYQDQCIDVARACGLGAADAAELRRAMSSARGGERMAALRGRLERGLADRGLDAAARAEVLASVQAFAGYGFVKGHAAAFAYLAYMSCWLKVYHPAVFCAALLDAQPMGFYPSEVVLQDAARHGVRALPADIQRGRAGCTIEDNGRAVRLGLRQIRGLGGAACGRIEAAMRGEERLASLEDLCARARLDEDEDEALALAGSGALRGLVPERRQALWQAPVAARAARERWLPDLLAAANPPARLPSPTPAEELALDRRALGFSPGRHALSVVRPDLAHRALHIAADLPTVLTGAAVEIVGQVVSRQRPGTARGHVFLALSDEGGLINVAVPPAVYARDRRAVRGEALVWVRGVVERRDGVVSVRATRVRPLVEALDASTR